MPVWIWVKETQLKVGYWRKTPSCTLLAALAIWHIGMVMKNKTDSRASLKTDGSLSSILKIETKQFKSVSHF